MSGRINAGERRGRGDIHPVQRVARGANGGSVSVERLLESPELQFADRLFFSPVDGPYHVYVDPDEQLHHLFHNNRVEFADGENPFGENQGRYFPIFPVTIMITSERVLFVYGNVDDRRIVSIPHTEIVEVADAFSIHFRVRLRTHDKAYTMIISHGDKSHNQETVAAIEYVRRKSDSASVSGGFDPESNDEPAVGSVPTGRSFEI
jgi:hypothetical protein